MRFPFVLACLLLCLSTTPAAKSQERSGIPVYRPVTVYQEIGRLQPVPFVVPTYWQHYSPRPTRVGQFFFGPWRSYRSPGPPMLFVPNQQPQ